jgi:hypothetical protein
VSYLPPNELGWREASGAIYTVPLICRSLTSQGATSIADPPPHLHQSLFEMDDGSCLELARFRANRSTSSARTRLTCISRSASSLTCSTAWALFVRVVPQSLIARDVQFRACE